MSIPPLATYDFEERPRDLVEEREQLTSYPDIPFGGGRIATMANSSVSSADLPSAGNNRPAASPSSSIAGAYAGANGANNGANYASPLPAGHQQDLHYLYEQIQELSSLLKTNRERTAELTKLAEQAEV